MSEEKIVGTVVPGNVIRAPEPKVCEVCVLLVKGGKMPTKATPEAAGLDLYSRIDAIVPNRSRIRIPVGIRTVVPPGFYFQVQDKSGLATWGIDRRAGVVDSDYRDEWEVILVNDTVSDYSVSVGDRIAQAVLLELPEFELKEVNSVEFNVVSLSNRGGGFGSTGK